MPRRPDRQRSIQIGLIAEDDSDIAVIKTLITKISRGRFKIEKFVGDGCGKIVGKCRAWARELHRAGCQFLIIVHDLDTADIHSLRSKINKALGNCPIGARIIIIPVREIEAWLLADHVAITRVFGLRPAMPRVANPEAELRPKEKLSELVYRLSRGKRRYINAIDNPAIATRCTSSNLRRCDSYRPFETFVSAIFSK